MAGHSRWANIKHRKAKQDAGRSERYTKLIREITVAAKLQGGEIETNPRLRTAVYKAQQANVTKDMIQRAIARGTAHLETEHLEEICYEGYGPTGVALMVTCFTDNRNRTAADVRHAFSKYGGNLATTGAVAYLFKKCGQLIVPQITEDAIETLMEIALDAGAEDVLTQSDHQVEILTSPETLMVVRQALVDAKIKTEHVDVLWRPNEYVTIDDDETAEKIMRLIDALDALDDVQAVYSNIDMR